MIKKNGNETQAFVLITDEQSEWMNRSSLETKIRYVKTEVEESSALTELRVKYEEKYGKKPHHLWKEDTIKEKLEE
ncbi:MAG: hypothetical protein AB8G11_09680 [Saprospiraceae bacterium]